jgi:hypothetical protein
MHLGPSLWTMTIYGGSAPTCMPHVCPAETGDVEARTNARVHNLRNETNSVAHTVVTFLLLVGAPLRTGLPDPGYCEF